MASITTEGRSELIALYTAIFNAAPGATNLSEIVLLKESGKSLEEVATFLTGKADFAKVYPALLTADEFAARLVANMLPAETSADATTWASNWVKSQLASGKGAAFVFASAVQAVRSTTSPDFKPAKDLLANKVEVSTYFSVTKLLSDPDLLDLQNVLTGVSSSSASVTTAKTAVDAIASAASVVTPVAFPLTTSVENKILGAGDDTFDSLNSATSQTLNAGDVLDGLGGTDRLNIVSSIVGGTLGTGVQTKSVEQLSVNAVGATTVDASLMAGVTDVYNTSSLNAVTVTGLTKIANVHVVNTNASTTATFAADAVVGAADATTVLLNGAATTANSTVTVDGIETINLVAAGTASGSATSTATVTSNALTTLNITGVSAVVSAGLPGATATVTGTVTSDAGAHDVTITGVVALDKLSVSMLAGNDTVRISTIAATHTISGGDGTDTLVSTAAITTTTGANISGFEAVSAGAVAVALPTGNLINAVTFTGTGGSVSTVLSGATVSQAATGTNTVSNTAWTTGTADSLTVNVGAAGTAAGSTGAITQNLTATGIETATINNLQNNDVAARTVGVTGANLKTLTVNSANTAAPITISATAGGTALTAIDASNVAGVVAFAASTTNTAAAGFSLKTGAGADALTGLTGADTLDGGSGNDTITGGVGIDSLTGGAGADTFVFNTNVAGAVVSSLAAPDVVADFVSGTDKLQITQAITAFLGNYPSVASAQAAAAADGRGNLAYFVTSDKQLYVATAGTGVASATDTVISLPNTATLAVSGADLLLGSQGSNTVAIAITAPGTLSTTANAGASAPTTNTDDTITQASTVAVGTGVGGASAINGGLGLDTYNLTIATQAGLSGLTTSAANTTSVALTSVETVNVTVTANTGVTTIAALPATLTTLTVTGTDGNAGLSATFGATGQTINVANTTLAGNASTITFGAFAGVNAGVATQTVNTGSANDTFNTIAVDGIKVDAGPGNDIFNVTDVLAFDNDGIAITIAGGLGTDVINVLGASATFNFADTDDVVMSGIETLTVAAAGAGAQTVNVSLPAGTTFRTINSITDTNDQTINITATAAQIAALTSVVNGLAADATGVFNLISSDTASVTANLSAIAFIDGAAGSVVPNVDSISFAATLAANVVTVTIDENLAVVGGASTTADILNYTATGAGTMTATAFEIVNFTTAAQAGAVVAPVGAITINSSVAQAGLTAAAVTTAINTSNATGTVVLTDGTGAVVQTTTHTGAGALTLTMANDTRTADTVVSTGAGIVTVNQIVSAGLTTVTLAVGTSADVISVAPVLLSTDRVVVNNFNASAQDKIILGDTQTTAGTTGALPVTQVVSAAGAVTFANTNDVLILNFEMGGATEVLAGDFTGGSLLANLGGALTVTADTNKGYIVAFDAGNMYLYHVVEGADGGNVIVADADIVLIGVFNGVGVGQMSSSDFGNI